MGECEKKSVSVTELCGGWRLCEHLRACREKYTYYNGSSSKHIQAL